MRKEWSILFIILILTSCAKNKDNSTPNAATASDKIFFTTYASGTEGWSHLYSISTSSLKVNDESPGINGWEPRIFQGNNINGKLNSIYHTQYQTNQSDVSTLITPQGTVAENIYLPKNTYDMLLTPNNKLIAIGYDNGEISVSSPQFDITYLASSRLDLPAPGTGSSYSNLIGVLYGAGSYFAVSSGNPGNYYTPPDIAPHIYQLGFTDGDSNYSNFLKIINTTDIESGNSHSDTCRPGTSGQMRISQSKILVTCNAQYQNPSSPQILNTFLIDVSSGLPVITKLISKTVTSEYVYTLGGLSSDKTKVLITESSGYKGTVLNSYWLDTEKPLGNNVITTYNVAGSVTYNAATNSYLYSCIRSSSGCVNKAFALSTSDMTQQTDQFTQINLDINLGNDIKFAQML